MTITLLDAGIATSLGTEQLDKFSQQCRLALRGRFDAAADLMITRGPGSNVENEKQRKIFVEKVGNVIRDIVRSNGRLSDLKVGTVVTQIMNAARRAHVKIDPQFASVLSSAIIADGVGRQLDNDIDVVSIANRWFFGIAAPVVSLLRKIHHRLN